MLLDSQLDLLHLREWVKQIIRLLVMFKNILGVSDIEMQDLLSISKVLNEVFQYSKPEKYMRLRYALKNLIVERDPNTWNWYHRQLKETAISRFSIDEAIFIHSVLGSYFSDTLPITIKEERLITNQKLTYNTVNTSIWNDDAKINIRRCTEGFFHLVEGKMLKEASDELCSFDVIYGCILIGQGYDVVNSIILFIAFFYI